MKKLQYKISFNIIYPYGMGKITYKGSNVAECVLKAQLYGYPIKSFRIIYGEEPKSVMFDDYMNGILGRKDYKVDVANSQRILIERTEDARLLRELKKLFKVKDNFDWATL